MSYLPSADDMSTPDVVVILKDPGGGLVVPKPAASFPFVPIALALVAAAILLGGK